MSKSVNRRSFLSTSSIAGVGATALVTGCATTTTSPSIASVAAASLRYGPAPGIAKLNANENPFGPSEKALTAIMEASKKGAYYVGESVPRLKAMIAERHGVTPEYISLSAGSSGVLSYFAVAKSKSGHILGPDLFWDTTAKAAVRQGGEIVYLPKKDDLAIDLTSMYEAIAADTAMVQVTNPNNPTGLVIDGKELEAFCRKASKKTTVLIDEAYNELTEDPEYTSMVPLVKEGLDVVVARTFSKIYGLAGMRVGYMIASPENTALINQYGLGDYAMNQAGVAAAIASYDDIGFIAMSKSKIIEARESIVDAIESVGLSALPSSTNFVFVNLGDLDAELFRQSMANQNVLIRGIYRDYTNWSRVSMGYPQDVQRYVSALPRVVDQLSATTA